MAEKNHILIVDEADRVIGSKERGTITHADIYRVAALWVINSQSHILLAQRKWSKKNDPGKWGPAAAGTVDKGETYESNIYKEAREEIGLEGTALAIGPKYFIDDGQHRFFTQWFFALTDQPIDAFAIQKEEVEQIAWIRKDILAQDIEKNPEKFVAGAHTWKELL